MKQGTKFKVKKEQAEVLNQIQGQRGLIICRFAASPLPTTKQGTKFKVNMAWPWLICLALLLMREIRMHFLPIFPYILDTDKFTFELIIFLSNQIFIHQNWPCTKQVLLLLTE